jgi:hypothetical protein
MARQVFTQFPDPRTKKLVRPLFNRQGKKIRMCLRSLVGADKTRQLMTADDIAALERKQARRRELATGD